MEGEFFFILFYRKYICLICKESLTTPKEYNLKRHYTSFHKSYRSFDSLERKNELKKLKASLASQRNIFHRAKNISENATYASYEVAHLIAKHGKPFSGGEFVKEFHNKVVRRVIPEKMDDSNNGNLTRQTITGEWLSCQLTLKIKCSKSQNRFISIQLRVMKCVI